MATTTAIPAIPATNNCPFCNKPFQKVGNHLPHCKERGGRDYSMFLSKKTLDNKRGTRSRKPCPQCNRLFVRLDTHLRNNSSCRKYPDISKREHAEQPSSLLSTPPSLLVPPTRQLSPDPPTSVLSPAPSSLPISTAAQPSPSSLLPASPSIRPPDLSTSSDQEPRTLPACKLPSSDEEWDEADFFFKDDIVPRVLQATTVDDKHSVLVKGLYEYFEGKYGTVKARPSKKHPNKSGQHDRALKKVTKLKNEARSQFRKAKRNGSLADEVTTLAKNFFKLVRKQSALKKQSNKAQLNSTAAKERQECHKHFWSFARKLLDDNNTSNIHPSFTAEEASDYFRKVYASEPREFAKPDWMPSPPPPSMEFEAAPIEDHEIRRVIKKSKSKSSPSPFDRVSYAILKNCPSLLKALADLYNACWSTSTVPRAWKTAAIKLIAKSSAKDNPSQPSNFRPIALTSCVGKIFTSILRTRWLDYMVGNGYLDNSLQKGFMPNTPGCIEHHCKLARILHEARSRHRAIAVTWLDLANAYGSVHHSLIQFSLKHYHAPTKFYSIVEHLYSDLSATILSADWCTPTIPLNVGVYQGDPLSVVIFNTVINTLVDTLKTQADLGYKVHNTSYSINMLQYADDTCLVANSPSACQHLLKTTDMWLDWSLMRAKIPKCCAVSLQASTGHYIDPQLTLSGQSIPFLGNNTIKFLGLPIQVPRDPSQSRAQVKKQLLSLDRSGHLQCHQTTEAEALQAGYLSTSQLAPHYLSVLQQLD